MDSPSIRLPKGFPPLTKGTNQEPLYLLWKKHQKKLLVTIDWVFPILEFYGFLRFAQPFFAFFAIGFHGDPLLQERWAASPRAAPAVQKFHWRPSVGTWLIRRGAWRHGLYKWLYIYMRVIIIDYMWLYLILYGYIYVIIYDYICLYVYQWLFGWWFQTFLMFHNIFQRGWNHQPVIYVCYYNWL